MSQFWNRLFGYRQLREDTEMPGAFPQETSEPRQRNHFNSASISDSMHSVSSVVNTIIIKPIVIVLVVFFLILAKFLNVIYFKDQNYIRTRSLSNTTANNTLVNDPIDKVTRFVRALEENLTPEQQFYHNHTEHDLQTDPLPPFFQGSYTQALYMAHQRAKFLFVYLTHPQNEGSSRMLSKIVTNPDFVSIFYNNDNTIIWGGDLTNPEAYQLANSLNVTKFPFLGVLCLTRNTTMTPQGPAKTAPKISLISKMQGSITEGQDPVHMVNKFKKRMAKYNDELNSIREELKEKFMNQMMLRQQELNYQNSLAKDKLKKQQREYEKTKKLYLAWKTKYFEDLKQAPAADSARIAIKLPTGVRTTFLFPPTEKVESIFVYVELLMGDYFNKELEVTILDEEAQTKFANFKLNFNFKLLSPLPPRQTLNDMMQNQVKDVQSVYPNGLLIVEQD